MTCTSSFSLIHNVLAFSFLRSQCHYLNTFLLRKQCTTVRLKRSKRSIECSRETSLKRNLGVQVDYNAKRCDLLLEFKYNSVLYEAFFRQDLAQDQGLRLSAAY